MASIVLVHGSWHGAWCWYKITARLRAAGHEVLVPDLPGHGRDRAELATITLEAYADRVVEALDLASEPALLVGHSRGGVAISMAAERRPERVRRLIYLAAFLLRDGESVLDLAPLDHESLVLPNLDFDPDGGWDMLREEAFVPALYADCSPEDVELARALLTPEPAAPSRTPLQLSARHFGSVPRVYIELLDDRAVGLSLQRRMHEATPCASVLSLQTSHSAYFSQPDELTALLEAAAD